ncbi:MAG TPA: RES family NAD+ phosphorylase [Candidatus Saccharimonadales bacterium]|nr:RES family NAD+ phosphorylase [Candidatus Saccharimonadales bacterium]
MKSIPNPQYEIFVAWLKRTKRPFSKWHNIAFRAAPLEFARVIKLLDGKGSFKFGGRWSSAGTFPAANLSTTQGAALDESNASFTYYKLPLADVRPRAVVGVRLRLDRVIDLTNPQGIRKQPWLHLQELLAEDWRKVNDAGHESQSQAFGRAAHDVGAEALLAPSVRVPGGVNLVYFPESVPSGKVEILGREELERWLRKR